MGAEESEKIVQLLDGLGVPFEIIEHEPVHTSADAARVRDAPLHAGVKAIVLRSSEGKFFLACLPGDMKIDTKKLSKILGTKNLHLAAPSEVLQETGCEIGSVSPFGNIYRMKTFFDTCIQENEYVEFNIGLLTKSIRMLPAALISAIRPELAEFAKL